MAKRGLRHPPARALLPHTLGCICGIGATGFSHIAWRLVTLIANIPDVREQAGYPFLAAHSQSFGPERLAGKMGPLDLFPDRRAVAGNKRSVRFPGHAEAPFEPFPVDDPIAVSAAA